MADESNGAATGGVLLVGSVPLGSADEVFQVMVAELGDRLAPAARRRDRAALRLDRVAVPGAQLAPRVRGLPARRRSAPRPAAPARPRRRVGRDAPLRRPRATRRPPCRRTRTFARRKRDGLIPIDCRFQVSLPTPLAPIAAFVAPEDQARIEPLYEARMINELTTIFDAIPHDQLAIQWDTNFEFAMLDGVMPTWFSDPRSSIVERLVRLGRSIPADVTPRLPLLPRPRAPPPRPALRRPAARRHRQRAVAQPRPLARLDPPAGAGGLRRPPLLRDAGQAVAAARDPAVPRPAPPLRRAGRRPRPASWPRSASCTTSASPPTAAGAATGRRRSRALIELHRAVTTPIEPVDAAGRRLRLAGRAGTASPTTTGSTSPIDAFGAAYDSVDHHGWYRNLDPTVEELSHLLADGDVLIDYSGGTGILARPAEAADVRHPGRRRHRRQLAEVPAGRAREVPRRSEGRPAAAALPEGREAPPAARRGARARAARAGRRRDRVDQRHPPLPRPGRHGQRRGCGCCGPAATSSSTRATSATRGPAAASGSSTRRCGWSASSPRVWCAPTRRTPPTAPISTTRSACAPTPPTATACSCSPGRSTSTSRRSSSAGLKVESVREASIEAGVQDWYELLVAYHDAVLGWVGRHGEGRRRQAPPRRPSPIV